MSEEINIVMTISIIITFVLGCMFWTCVAIGMSTLKMIRNRTTDEDFKIESEDTVNRTASACSISFIVHSICIVLILIKLFI